MERLGFDVDEVVADILTPSLDILNQKNGTDYNPEDVTDYGMGSVGVLDTNLFFCTYNDKIFRRAKPFPESVYVLNQLKREGYNLSYVTSRCYNDNESERLLQWLNRHKIPADNIVCYVEDKGIVTNYLNLDFFVDDNPDNLYDIQESGLENVVLFNKPYNDEVEGFDRVYTWEDIYDHIKNSE
jgi:5'(3')-deoxyribonucleotidase